MTRKIFVSFPQIGGGTIMIEGTLCEKSILGSLVESIDFTTNPLFFAFNLNELLEQGLCIFIPHKNEGTRTVVSIGGISRSEYCIADVPEKKGCNA